MKRMKHHPQAILHIGCGLVAVWFLMAELQGEDTMPAAIYGLAGEVYPPMLWASFVIVAVLAFLTGWLVRSPMITAIGSGLHMTVMAALAGFCISVPGFSPIAPWTALLAAVLAICFARNLQAIVDAHFEDWP